MQKITQKLVAQLNEKVSSENFEQIVEKYNLDTPKEYSHEKLCEQDGIEVWGVSDWNWLLVYDNNDGFYLISKGGWIEEIKNIFGEDADEILEELGVNKPIYHEFRIVGVEAVEKKVVSGNNTSARINVPVNKIGKRVMLVWLE